MEDDEQEEPKTYADLFVDALSEDDDDTLIDLLQFAAVMQGVEVAESED